MMAFLSYSSSGCFFLREGLVDVIRTGIGGLILRISVSASIPSMAAMRISRRIRSKGSCSTAFTASRPSAASATLYPSSLKTACSMIRWLSSSSTTKIRGFSLIPAPDPSPSCSPQYTPRTQSRFCLMEHVIRSKCLKGPHPTIQVKLIIATKLIRSASFHPLRSPR
jgi:hypothetical protein